VAARLTTVAEVLRQPTDRLYADLKVLSDHCRFVGLSDILEALHGNRPFAELSVAICFDDGYNLPQSGVCDMLQEFSVQATCFVITACMNNAHLMWMHKAAAMCSRRGTDSFLRAHNQFSERSGSVRQ
jgi:peptidoglycan/xylan/chitin deacetylase (PgdA/CDA1 family)